MQNIGRLLAVNTPQLKWAYKREDTETLTCTTYDPRGRALYTTALVTTLPSTCSTLYFGLMDSFLSLVPKATEELKKFLEWASNVYHKDGAFYSEIMCTIPIYNTRTIKAIESLGFEKLGPQFKNRRSGNTLQHFVLRITPEDTKELNIDVAEEDDNERDDERDDE